MLRITRMIGGASVDPRARGTLHGPWVDQTHDAHALSAALTSRVYLDLSGLTFADEAGAALLRELLRAVQRAAGCSSTSRNCSDYNQGVDQSDETDPI